MRCILAVLAVVVALSAPGAAVAHSDVVSTNPADDDHVLEPPSEVSITFKEPPTADSRFEVEDGCDEDVLADVARDGTSVALQISPGGSTGAWTVRYRVISATDGHLVRGDFSFLVGRGPLRCSEEPETDETPAMASPLPDEESARDGDDDDGSDFPILPVVVGGGVIVALAAAVRMMSAR